MNSICNGCTYCCWALGIDELPKPLTGEPSRVLCVKQELTDCPYQIAGLDGSCRIHGHIRYPKQCSGYQCIYYAQEEAGVYGELLVPRRPVRHVRVHWPLAFDALLRRISEASLIPAVPTAVPLHRAVDLIERTRIMPATNNRDTVILLRPIQKDRLEEYIEASRQEDFEGCLRALGKGLDAWREEFDRFLYWRNE